MIFNPILASIFKTKTVIDKEGNTRTTDDMISEEEGEVLYRMIKKSNASKTLEVGLAHGVSALIFCQAHSEVNSIENMHYAVDPNQLTFYNEAACVAIENAGYKNIFKLLNGPSHLKIPELIEKKLQLDCVFIDGWHTFDYTLVDFFLTDKLLKPGGYMAFHDTYGRAKQKVINFILTHRKYEIDKELMQFSKEPFGKVLKFFIWRLYKDPMLLFSWFHWRYQLKSTSGLIILRKKEQFEPSYDFFKNF